jgi:hypothetical protein
MSTLRFSTLDRVRSGLLLPALALGVAATTCFCSPDSARGDDVHRNKIYDSKGFEPKTFIAGEPLLGTGGWSTAIPPFLNPQAAVITNAASSQRRQSVEVWGGDLISSQGITLPYDAVGSYRRPVNYTVVHDQTVSVKADLLLETLMPPTEDDFFSMTIAVRSGAGETLGELGLSSSGFAVAYDFNALPGAEPLFIAPIEFNKWQRLKIEVDYVGDTAIVSYHLNGKLLGVVPTPSTSKVVARGSMVVYALPDSDGNERVGYTARMDNFQIRANNFAEHN